ncbi:hypothetical protein OAA11_02075 [Schleiferiaceae bacterium]|nr:hypothetical protein [Schleiferiaceae bacterium]
MKYNTDKRTRKKIDKLLEQNARNVANFGTKGKHDLITKSEFNKAWTDIQREIRELDADFYKVIKAQN